MSERLVEEVNTRSRVLVSILAAALITAYISFSLLASSQRDFATAVNMAGKLRYSSQAVALKGEMLVNAAEIGNPANVVSARQDEMKRAITNFRDFSWQLRLLLVDLPVSGEVSYLFSEKGTMTAAIGNYAQLADKILEISPQNLSHRSPLHQALPTQADTVLAEADRAVSLIERDSHRRTLLLQTLGMAGMASGLLLLGSVYLMILKPLVRRVESDLEARKQAAQAIETARAAAEASSRAKSLFLANMSHELRSPLNAVIGFAEMMEMEVLGPIGNDRYKDYAKGIRESGRHLLDLINDVLDMAKDEAGKLTLSEHIVLPAEITESVRFLLERQANAKNVIFRLEIEIGLPAIKADPLRLKQVLINLGVNAIKFTPPEGTVTMAARRARDGGILFEVSDTGIGMAPEDVPKALEIFGQIEGQHQHKQGGTGLGLPLSRRLIELHGGRLEISSQPGAGTSVVCTLPPSRLTEEENSAAARLLGTVNQPRQG